MAACRHDLARDRGRRVVRAPLVRPRQFADLDGARATQAGAGPLASASCCPRARSRRHDRPDRSTRSRRSTSARRWSTRSSWSTPARRTARAEIARAARRRGLSRVELLPAVRPRRSARATRCGARCRSRAATSSCTLDSDTADFGRHFVYGLLGPLLDRPGGAVREGAPTTGPFTAPDGTVDGRRRPRDRADRQAAASTSSIRSWRASASRSPARWPRAATCCARSRSAPGYAVETGDADRRAATRPGSTRWRRSTSARARTATSACSRSARCRTRCCARSMIAAARGRAAAERRGGRRLRAGDPLRARRCELERRDGRGRRAAADGRSAARRVALRCVYTDLDGTMLGRGASLLRDAEGNFSRSRSGRSRPATAPASRS